MTWSWQVIDGPSVCLSGTTPWQSAWPWTSWGARAAWRRGHPPWTASSWWPWSWRTRWATCLPSQHWWKPWTCHRWPWTMPSVLNPLYELQVRSPGRWRVSRGFCSKGVRWGAIKECHRVAQGESCSKSRQMFDILDIKPEKNDWDVLDICRGGTVTHQEEGCWGLNRQAGELEEEQRGDLWMYWKKTTQLVFSQR